VFRWIDEFYARLRPAMPAPLQRWLDFQLEHWGYGALFGDCVEFAAEHGLLTDEDRRQIKRLLDFGLLRKAAPYFEELIAAEPRNSPDAEGSTSPESFDS
jgi:hypothetical protein